MKHSLEDLIIITINYWVSAKCSCYTGQIWLHCRGTKPRTVTDQKNVPKFSSVAIVFDKMMLSGFLPRYQIDNIHLSNLGSRLNEVSVVDISSTVENKNSSRKPCFRRTLHLFKRSRGFEISAPQSPKGKGPLVRMFVSQTWRKKIGAAKNIHFGSDNCNPIPKCPWGEFYSVSSIPCNNHIR